MEIRQLRPSERQSAADLLSRAMRDNPINMAVFGPDDACRQRALALFFETALQGLERRGLVLGAFGDGAMLGVCGVAPPGQCQPATPEKLRMVPVLLKTGSIAHGSLGGRVGSSRPSHRALAPWPGRRRGERAARRRWRSARFGVLHSCGRRRRRRLSGDG